MNPINQQFIVLLRCPNIGAASSIAASVVEDELKVVLRDYDMIAEEGIPHGWMEESYATQVRSRLLDHRGQVRLTGSETEYWNVKSDPDKAIDFYAKEAEQLMQDLMDHNHEQLIGVAISYIVDDLRVIKRLPGMWIIQLTGAQL